MLLHGKNHDEDDDGEVDPRGFYQSGGLFESDHELDYSRDRSLDQQHQQQLMQEDDW